MHDRGPPLVPDDLRTHDDVPQLPRQPIREIVERVDRECERVGYLVDPQMLLLQRTTLLRRDEHEAELAGVDSFGGKDATRQLPGALLVDRDARAIVDLDLDHRLRAVPVS